MNKRDTSGEAKEIEVVRFEGGDIDGLKKSALILYTKDGRKVQFIVDKSVLMALGGLEDTSGKISTFYVLLAVMSAMGASVKESVIYTEGRDYPNRASMHLVDAEGVEHVVDTVPDYAVILTFRMGGVLKVSENVLNEKARSIFDERFRYLFEGEQTTIDLLKNRTREELASASRADLRRFMKAALESEEYQIAAMLKDVIESRGNEEEEEEFEEEDEFDEFDEFDDDEEDDEL
jgi:bifunctional DNase/RNase